MMTVISQFSAMFLKPVTLPFVCASAQPWVIVLIAVGAILLVYLWFELSLGRVLFRYATKPPEGQEDTGSRSYVSEEAVAYFKTAQKVREGTLDWR